MEIWRRQIQPDFGSVLTLLYSQGQQGRLIEILRKMTPIIELRESHTVVIDYSVWCDDSIALINEEQGGFIAVKGVQLLFAGAAAIQHHVMISADLL